MNRNRNKKCSRKHGGKRSIQSRNISSDGVVRDESATSSSNNDATNVSERVEQAEDKVNSTELCKLNQHSSNMIPEFDPSNDESNIDNFLSKVNECAERFKWNDEDTTRYALSKLKGGAKTWLQDLTSVTYDWPHWQDLLHKAFPYNLEYPEILALMLERHLKVGDDVEEYYYDKLALLYPCDINGNKAVDCIIHGIEDFCLRVAATEAQCSEPVELLNLLKDIYYEQRDSNGWCV